MILKPRLRYLLILSVILPGILLIITICFPSCKVPYEPVVDKSSQDLLVVEGYINTGGGPITIKLTRTLDVKTPPSADGETGATLKIEGEDGSSISAVTNSSGLATFATTLNNPQRYRLLITTRSGRRYGTPFLENKQTPEIEQIGYKADSVGIQLYVNTEDKTASTRYYAWAFDETWETIAAFVRGPALNPPPRPICWPTAKSTSIYIASSLNLSADRINEFPLVFIDGKSEKLSRMYSINVFQYGLTKEAYDYLGKMKKNSEQIGSIFDPQPSYLTGNIQCISDPSEKVIGFISCGVIREKRVFISPSEISKINSNWIFSHPCNFLIPLPDPPPPYPELCYTCEGTRIRPSYWPTK
ncbi:MAG TPA: DUF4249 domain-containing protein [Pedobacter sp.]|jgi:hypothetical protein